MRQVFGFVPRGRVRPTDAAPLFTCRAEDLAKADAPQVNLPWVCREMRWGWSVPWDKKLLVNAKSETLTTLPTFQPHLENRCLIPASSFKEGGAQFHQPEWEVFFLAGLFRPEPLAALKENFVMLTTTPNESVAPFHDRMPFIVRAADAWDWLAGDWRRVLAAPDQSPLEKFQKQPELF